MLTFVIGLFCLKKKKKCKNKLYPSSQPNKQNKLENN